MASKPAKPAGNLHFAVVPRQSARSDSRAWGLHWGDRRIQEGSTLLCLDFLPAIWHSNRSQACQGAEEGVIPVVRLLLEYRCINYRDQALRWLVLPYWPYVCLKPSLDPELCQQEIIPNSAKSHTWSVENCRNVSAKQDHCVIADAKRSAVFQRCFGSFAR